VLYVTGVQTCALPISFLEEVRADRGLSAGPEAARPILLRRVYLDLIGLPPTPAEQAAFEADPSPDAYERVVDRLLASPHYGERRSEERRVGREDRWRR